MFDQRSTGAERKQMLEAIIKAEDDDNDADEVPEDESINHMVARSDDEFEIFQRMDIDRRRQDADDEHRRPRLLEESEVPPQIIEQHKRFLEQEKEGPKKAEEPLEPSRRRRREVNYSHVSAEGWARPCCRT